MDLTPPPSPCPQGSAQLGDRGFSPVTVLAVRCDVGEGGASTAFTHRHPPGRHGVALGGACSFGHEPGCWSTRAGAMRPRDSHPVSSRGRYLGGSSADLVSKGPDGKYSGLRGRLCGTRERGRGFRRLKAGEKLMVDGGHRVRSVLQSRLRAIAISHDRGSASRPGVRGTRPPQGSTGPAFGRMGPSGGLPRGHCVSTAFSSQSPCDQGIVWGDGL